MKITIPGNKTSGKGPSPPGPGRTGDRNVKLTSFKILIAFFLLASCAVNVFASVEKVEGGIQFTYYDPDAGQAYVAGSFNGWSTTANPMTKDENGYWTVVIDLGFGEHEYKFVVDGAWITDIDNPALKSDGYGGNNSVVEIDNKGEIVVKAAAHPISNTLLSSKVFIGGRYLSRTNVERGVEDDPRWRMQRPVQNVDFNFRVTISEIVRGYSRLRIDTGEKILQPNNISAYLDEAHLEISPAAFNLTGFYNEEMLVSKDPLSFVGDVDLPGTIFDDHLNEGKGTSGAVVSSNQFGIALDGFIVNVHDYDYYNNPNLYDNTGTDLVHVRASKEYDRGLWKLTAGANFFIMRSLWWLDFTGLVGTLPANTGLARLDDYLDRSDDTSDWFEFEDEAYHYGLDLTLHLYDSRLMPQFEYLWGLVKQSFVTSNRSGIDFGNGPIDVPILERDARTMHGALKCTLLENVFFNAEHTRRETIHANEDEDLLMPLFIDDAVANKHIFFISTPNPPTTTMDYSEVELRWNGKQFDAVLWLQRNMNRYDSHADGSDEWYYELSLSPGLNANPISKLGLEVELQYSQLEGSNPFWKGSSIEAIARGSLVLTKDVSAVFDVRHLYIDDEKTDETDSYTAPYAGFRYDPAKKVSIVLAYGVDPLDFGIDYEGRHIGRYMFRQQYLWENPQLTWKAAEEALANKRVISLRAIFNF